MLKVKNAPTQDRPANRIGHTHLGLVTAPLSQQVLHHCPVARGRSQVEGGGARVIAMVTKKQTKHQEYDFTTGLTGMHIQSQTDRIPILADAFSTSIFTTSSSPYLQRLKFNQVVDGYHLLCRVTDGGLIPIPAGIVQWAPGLRVLFIC